MTPETANILSSLREDFYSLFQAKMKQPVKVTNGKSLIFNPAMAPIASWVDAQDRMNYASIYAHTAPDQLIPHRPLLLRMTVNVWPRASLQGTKKPKNDQCNRDWAWELTVLPEEIKAFAPWLARWIDAGHRPQGNPVRPPYALEHFAPPDARPDVNVAWTEAALAALEADQALVAAA